MLNKNVKMLIISKSDYYRKGADLLCENFNRYKWVNVGRSGCDQSTEDETKLQNNIQVEHATFDRNFLNDTLYWVSANDVRV